MLHYRHMWWKYFCGAALSSSFVCLRRLWSFNCCLLEQGSPHKSHLIPVSRFFSLSCSFSLFHYSGCFCLVCLLREYYSVYVLLQGTHVYVFPFLACLPLLMLILSSETAFTSSFSWKPKSWQFSREFYLAFLPPALSLAPCFTGIFATYVFGSEMGFIYWFTCFLAIGFS